MSGGLDPSSHQARFATALLDPSLDCPVGLRTWNGSDPLRRLAVHRNNVVGSLIDALADTFAVTQQLVGTDFFRAMAAVFVRQHPPRSRILAHYGDDFAAFIAGFAPVAALPYLADMARLEFARVQACHAAEAEPIAEAAWAKASTRAVRSSAGASAARARSASAANSTRHWVAHASGHTSQPYADSVVRMRSQSA